MMHRHPSTKDRDCCRCSQLPRALRKRGYASVSAVLLITVGIVTMLLVVNWTYLNLARQRTQELVTTLSYSAAHELLDDAQLEDFPAPPAYNQADDLSAARTLLDAPLTGLIARHNAVSGEPLRVNAPSDLTVLAARIEDASSPPFGANFDNTIVAGQRANTLMVNVAREASGANPVNLIIRGWGSPEAATIEGTSYATLDSRVIGFRPTSSIASPVAPLAISSDAWFVDRTSAPNDSNANNRPELDVIIQVDAGTVVTNGAFVNLNENLPFLTTNLANQIRSGVLAASVAPGGLGPATEADPMDLAAEAEVNSSVAGNLEDAFLDVIASSDPRRVFPIFDAASPGSVEVIGFIAARVLDVAIESTMLGDRLRVRLEPEFLIHRTVVTSYRDSTSTIVPENTYIHKVRLTR